MTERERIDFRVKWIATPITYLAMGVVVAAIVLGLYYSEFAPNRSSSHSFAVTSDVPAP